MSSVQLKSECLSQGVKRMSCSSGGDSPQFSWTLDRDVLTDDQLLSGNNETDEISVKATVSGQLVCSVSNRVSKASRAEMVPACGEWRWFQPVVSGERLHLSPGGLRAQEFHTFLLFRLRFHSVPISKRDRDQPVGVCS